MTFIIIFAVLFLVVFAAIAIMDSAGRAFSVYAMAERRDWLAMILTAAAIAFVGAAALVGLIEVGRQAWSLVA